VFAETPVLSATLKLWCGQFSGPCHGSFILEGYRRCIYLEDAADAVAVEKSCICQIKGHGHEPGKCPNEATQANDLCEHCHAKAQELLERQNHFLTNPSFDGNRNARTRMSRSQINPITLAGRYANVATTINPT
jgi:hypothetical protein